MISSVIQQRYCNSVGTSGKMTPTGSKENNSGFIFVKGWLYLHLQRHELSHLPVWHLFLIWICRAMVLFPADTEPDVPASTKVMSDSCYLNSGLS